METYYVYSEDFSGSRAVTAGSISEAWQEAKRLFGENVSVERA